ncbi:SDR family oxidoreductase [Paenibacillus sp.]|uniref:SDR family oxidoreductase n=1 Tax=Paenibacillus sp. TaxID=58172 RepID=UPI002D6A92A4|nr:SDR family oxidoreductase [Paenibacillus sp.]HZG86573.1 SDR family oxidoreductase [Paenibacillus sp.]
MSEESVYIVTGASRGLGEAIAARLLAPGNRVLCVARTRNEALAGKAEAAGARCDWFERDLAALAAANGADAFMRELLAGVDLAALRRIRLINNAGVVEPVGAAHENEPADVGRHLAVNLTAPMTLTAAFLRQTEALAADKRIMHISSGAGRNPYAGWSAYCAAKAGLDHFTRCVALEQAALPNGAKVASVAPGVVDTAMQAVVRATAPERFPNRERFVKLYETGGLTPPAEAAERLVAYLEHAAFGEEPVADIREWKAE